MKIKRITDDKDMKIVRVFQQFPSNIIHYQFKKFLLTEGI